MEGGCFFVVLTVVLAAAAYAQDDPPVRLECDCEENFNQTCEDGRGVCYYHFNATEYAYTVCRSYCGPPPDVVNAAVTTTVTYENSLEGNEFEYACTGSFFARENDIMTVVCPYDGTWTEPSFQCKYACSAPTPPALSSLVDPQYGYEPDAVASFECDLGYLSEGCLTATCNGTTGAWEHNGGSCTEHCPSNFIGFSGSCYHIARKRKRPWPNAKIYCADLGGYLVHISNAAEDTFIIDHIVARNNTRHSYWMGLTDRAVEGEYLWDDDNSTATYFNWGPNEPRAEYIQREDCVSFFARDKFCWNDLKCKKKNEPVCERPLIGLE